jgi:hypothetical protein
LVGVHFVKADVEGSEREVQWRCTEALRCSGYSQPNHLALVSLASSQAKSGATTIFVNELDAGSFKGPSNDL